MIHETMFYSRGGLYLIIKIKRFVIFMQAHLSSLSQLRMTEDEQEQNFYFSLNSFESDWVQYTGMCIFSSLQFSLRMQLHRYIHQFSSRD